MSLGRCLQWADIVFLRPAPGQEDLCIQPRQLCAPLCNNYCQYRSSAIRSQIFAGLAAQLGFHDAFTEGRTERQWLPLWQDLNRGRLNRALNCRTLTNLLPLASTNYRQERVANFGSPIFALTPKEQPLAAPSGKLELYSQRIESFAYDDCLARRLARTL